VPGGGGDGGGAVPGGGGDGGGAVVTAGGDAGWHSRVVTAWWQQGFTAGADPEYAEQLLPLAAHHLDGGGRVLDVGCGEGQVSRRAASAPGVTGVTGIDVSWLQLAAAASRGGGVTLGRADASALPFPPGAFDTVVACLVFEHLAGGEDAVAEVARVLRPGGRFLFFLNHPLLQTPGSGWVDDDILGEQYWRIGPYLTSDRSMEEVDAGVWIPYVHRPLSVYVNALAAGGLVVTRMEEPAPPPGFLARAGEYPEAETIPRLLFMRAEKLLAAG
jgi:SAM-dependent methyltransferase